MHHRDWISLRPFFNASRNSIGSGKAHYCRRPDRARVGWEYDRKGGSKSSSGHVPRGSSIVLAPVCPCCAAFFRKKPNVTRLGKSFLLGLFFGASRKLSRLALIGLSGHGFWSGQPSICNAGSLPARGIDGELDGHFHLVVAVAFNCLSDSMAKLPGCCLLLYR